MKRKLKFSIPAILLTVMLSGCYPTGEKKPADLGTETYVGKVSEKAGSVEFDYEIQPDLPAQAPRIKLKLKELDHEKVISVLLKDKNVKTTKVEGIYETDDNCRLGVGAGFSFYNFGVADSTKNFGNIASGYKKICYASDEQLKSFPSDEAVERVNKILDEIGIENYGEPYIIPITPEMGNAELEKNGLAFAETEEERLNYTLWEEDDGIYVLKYMFNCNGIDITPKGLKTLKGSHSTTGADITAYVTKDCIFYLDVPFYYDITVLDTTVDLKFGAGYASNQLIDRYTKITPRHQTFFTDCNLVYAPYEYVEKGEYIFTPVWRFSGYEVRELPEKQISSLKDCAEHYDAETGLRYGSN